MLGSCTVSVADAKVFTNLICSAIEEAQQYLDLVSRQWDQSLARLKAFVEP